MAYCNSDVTGCCLIHHHQEETKLFEKHFRMDRATCIITWPQVHFRFNALRLLNKDNQGVIFVKMFYCLILLSQMRKYFFFSNVLWKTLWWSGRGLAKVLRCLSVCLLKDVKETSICPSKEHLLTVWPHDCLTVHAALPSRQRCSYSLTAAGKADLSSGTSFFSSRKANSNEEATRPNVEKRQKTAVRTLSKLYF